MKARRHEGWVGESLAAVQQAGGRSHGGGRGWWRQLGCAAYGERDGDERRQGNGGKWRPPPHTVRDLFAAGIRHVPLRPVLYQRFRVKKNLKWSKKSEIDEGSSFLVTVLGQPSGRRIRDDDDEAPGSPSDRVSGSAVLCTTRWALQDLPGEPRECA